MGNANGSLPEMTRRWLYGAITRCGCRWRLSVGRSTCSEDARDLLERGPVIDLGTCIPKNLPAELDGCVVLLVVLDLALWAVVAAVYPPAAINLHQ